MSQDNPWPEASTLEVFVRAALLAGRDKEVIAIMNVLPEALKPRYREIWKEYRGEKK